MKGTKPDWKRTRQEKSKSTRTPKRKSKNNARILIQHFFFREKTVLSFLEQFREFLHQITVLTPKERSVGKIDSYSSLAIYKVCLI